MAPSFGFSVGDVITSILIIKQSISAVRSVGGAVTEYAELITELDSLQDGLQTIEELGLDRQTHSKHYAAIERATQACQACIDAFVASITKYQPHLKPGATGLTSTYRKIKWALCKKEDIAKLRMQLERHSSSITMILLAFQTHAGIAHRTDVALDRQMLQANTDAIVNNESRNSQNTAMLQDISTEQRQSFETFVLANKELASEVQKLLNMLELQRNIPPQVLLQQPVIFVDAFARVAPFHLEFIDSAEAFLAIIRIKFEQAGVGRAGLRKLKRSEFEIQETTGQRRIDLGRPWASVFQPGQRVSMSMVFQRLVSPSTCPACSTESIGGKERIEWSVLPRSKDNLMAILIPVLRNSVLIVSTLLHSTNSEIFLLTGI